MKKIIFAIAMIFAVGASYYLRDFMKKTVFAFALIFAVGAAVVVSTNQKAYAGGGGRCHGGNC